MNWVTYLGESDRHIINITFGGNFFFNSFYLFIFGCVGSSLLRAGFL